MDWQPIITPILTAIALGIASWVAKAFARVQKRAGEKLAAQTAKIKDETLRTLAEQAVQMAEQMAAGELKATAIKWTSAAKLAQARNWLAKQADLDPSMAEGLIEAALQRLKQEWQ